MLNEAQEEHKYQTSIKVEGRYKYQWQTVLMWEVLHCLWAPPPSSAAAIAPAAPLATTLVGIKKR